jgi:hypothetical protein
MSSEAEELRKSSFSREKATTGAKARTHSYDLRGPEGPLFHGSSDIREVLPQLLESHTSLDNRKTSAGADQRPRRDLAAACASTFSDADGFFV